MKNWRTLGSWPHLAVLVESLTHGFHVFWHVDDLKIIGNWNLTCVSKCEKRLQEPTLRLSRRNRADSAKELTW